MASGRLDSPQMSSKTGPLPHPRMSSKRPPCSKALNGMEEVGAGSADGAAQSGDQADGDQVRAQASDQLARAPLGRGQCENLKPGGGGEQSSRRRSLIAFNVCVAAGSATKLWSWKGSATRSYSSSSPVEYCT